MSIGCIVVFLVICVAYSVTQVCLIPFICDERVGVTGALPCDVICTFIGSAGGECDDTGYPPTAICNCGNGTRVSNPVTDTFLMTFKELLPPVCSAACITCGYMSGVFSYNPVPVSMQCTCT